MATSDTKGSFLRPPGTNFPPAMGKQSAHPMASAEETFRAILTLERRRAERSRNPFVQMLLDARQENGMAKWILHNAIDVAKKRSSNG